MQRLVSVLVLCGLFAHSAWAQVDTATFNVQIFGGLDASPPTTPTLLSATPVATTQINLSWSTSTDDFMVAGYNVFRDGVIIATTTLLSYADTGLTASTTYTYAVRAFDPTPNYSTTSNSLSTTTLEIVTPPPEADAPAQSTAARVVVRDLWIEPDVTTATINIETARPSRIEVRWGRTGSYEIGYVVGGVHATEHAIGLTDLEPGTTYEYEIRGYTEAGHLSLIETGNFSTLGSDREAAPPNVGRLSAVQDGSDVQLRWELPADETIASVRVVRSHLGFPAYPQDGAIVYQGRGSAATDEGILNQYSPVYYTVFTYDTAGNISSGALALVYALTVPEGVESSGDGVLPELPRQIATPPTVVPEATSSIVSERVTVDMQMPELAEIQVKQGDEVFSLFDETIVLDPEQAFTVLIPSRTIAGNLKSIILTILDPTDHRQSYSYLLRLNKDQTAYEATVPPLQVFGRSQLVVRIYDYEAFVVATYEAPVQLGADPGGRLSTVLFPDLLFERPAFLCLLLLFLIAIVLMILIFYRSRTEDNP